MTELIGKDPAFLAALERARRAATSPLHVLVLGESGSGKELVARLVHESSPRAGGPFVPLNCGAIPPHLVESELFGHERGAFTGADMRRPGVFEQADGGTLFLDEIGELPRAAQPALLRTLETRRIRRVGATLERPIDVRIVAATHVDLSAAASRGDFRLDLYHRIASVEIRLPPLRARRDDIPLLVERFLSEATRTHGPRTLRPENLAALVAHDWPGNIRELRNAIQRAVVLSDDTLRLTDLLPRPVPVLVPVPATKPDSHPTPPPHLDSVLRDLLTQALSRYGSHRKAAAAVGLPKSTFHDHARRLGILAPRP